MTLYAEGSFIGTRWDEVPFSEYGAAGSLARASIVNTWSGAIEGTGTLEYLLAYNPDGSASFIGYERVVGRIDGRAGSFVLQSSGTYTDGEAQGVWFVVEGSGTDELIGLCGEGGYHWPGTMPAARYMLDYEFA